MQNLILDNPSSIDRWHFPLYHSSNQFSCFRLDSKMELIPYDHIINTSITYDQSQHIELEIYPVTLDNYLETVINEIHNEIKDKECWIADTGGLDCNVIISIMNYFSVKYKTYCYDGDRSKHPQWYQNIQNCHWGFHQTPYFDNSINLVTGMYGDEYLLRNPYYVEQFLKIDLVKIYNKLPNCYMYNFFINDYLKKMNKGYKEDWFQILLNDYQLWSFGKINVINPFKNKNILMQGFSLDQDSIIKQVTDGFISKKIIGMMDAKRLDQIDLFKNQSDDSRLHSTNN